MIFYCSNTTYNCILKRIYKLYQMEKKDFKNPSFQSLINIFYLMLTFLMGNCPHDGFYVRNK